MAVGVQVGVSTAARNRTALIKRLTTLRGKWAAGNRPSDMPVGRWLGDFLDQKTETGLLDTELELLEGCANGADVNTRPGESSDKEETEADKEIHGAALREIALDERKECLWLAFSEHRVRARFLRFMILGGDKFAPVHEAGIQLWNAWVDGNVDLRSAKCVSRVALTNCVIDGDWLMQDASLDVLVLRGSHVRRFRANRAKISGAMWLDEFFISDTEVELFGIEIGGRLDCSYGHFEKGIAAPGTDIGGDLILSAATANAGLSFINADIGGSLIGFGAVLKASNKTGSALDISRSKIRGDALFRGAKLSAADWSEKQDRRALDAQNITVDGSVQFGDGFGAKGEVTFNGAAISKALDFSGGDFNNKSEFAIRAERSQVTGVIKFETSESGTDWFNSSGCVSLRGAQCGELNCAGGRFNNPLRADNKHLRPALDCDIMNISGSVKMCNAGIKQFHSSGIVSFYTSQIGQHMECGGGIFENPGYRPTYDDRAMNCQAIKVDGCVFLSKADETNIRQEKRDDLGFMADLAFKADGKVDFQAATIGLQFNCLSGRFNNIAPDRTKPKNHYAAIALTLAAARIGDGLYLGKESEADTDPPPMIDGSLDLTGATVRILLDDGLVGGDAGIPEFVPREEKKSKDEKSNDNKLKHEALNTETPNEEVHKAEKGDVPKEAEKKPQPLRCNLMLDQFTYERLAGEGAYKARNRREWLLRQPPEDLKGAFKPQPFEQLANVMRNMGYDDEADDIALFRRQREWRAKPWFKLWEPLGRVREFLFSKGSSVWAKPTQIVRFNKFAAVFGYWFAALFVFAYNYHSVLLAALAWVYTMAIIHWPLALTVAGAGLLLFRKFFAKLG